MSRCGGCNGDGLRWYADPSDADNGTPCSWCNPAGLAIRYGGKPGKIDVTADYAGSKSRSIRVRYACGCVARAFGNGHLKGKPTSVPTMCPKHKQRLSSFAETILTGFKPFPRGDQCRRKP